MFFRLHKLFAILYINCTILTNQIFNNVQTIINQPSKQLKNKYNKNKLSYVKNKINI